MEKKEYIKPELMVEEIASEALMLTMSNEEAIEQLSIGRPLGRRGSWGNLWSTED